MAIGLAAGAGLIAFLVLSPYVVVDWARFVRDVTTRGDGLVRPHGVDVGSGWRHHALVTLPAAFGWPLYVWSVAGVIGLLVWEFRRSIVVLSFPIAYYVVIGSLDTAFARYALPLIPFLALTAGWATIAACQFVTARVQAVGQVPMTLALAAVLAAPTVRESILLDRIFSRPDTRVVAADFLQRHVAPGDSIYLSGREYGRTPLPVRAGHVAVEERHPGADGVFARDLTGVEQLPTWLVLQRSPLREYSQVPGRIDTLARTRYTRVALVAATEPGHRGTYDQQDALFLPLWGLGGVLRIGPTVEIHRRTLP
jgi:hypothetical protein